MKELRVCKLSSCNVQFYPIVFNQTYHNGECRAAGAKREAEIRAQKAKNLRLIVRVCVRPECDTILSIYNTEDYCARHPSDIYRPSK